MRRDNRGLVALSIGEYWLGFTACGPVDRDWFLTQVSLYYEAPVISNHETASLGVDDAGFGYSYEDWLVDGVAWHMRIAWNSRDNKHYIVGVQQLDAQINWLS